MEKQIENAVRDVVKWATNGIVYNATKYLSPKLIVRAVRKRYKGKLLKNQNLELSLVIGRPNFAEREFIKDCLKAKEPFPIKPVQIKVIKK